MEAIYCSGLNLGSALKETHELGQVPVLLWAFVSWSISERAGCLLARLLPAQSHIPWTADLPASGSLAQGGAQPHSCSTKEGSEPAHGMVDGTEPCTSKEERLLPHIPTGQSKYCFQEGWRVAAEEA